jgi:hypothetical protein
MGSPSRTLGRLCREARRRLLKAINFFAVNIFSWRLGGLRLAFHPSPLKGRVE